MKVISRIGSAAALAALLTAGLGAPDATAAPSAPSTPAVHERAASYRVTLSPSEHVVTAGTRLVLSGKVRPAARGTKVILQKRIHGARWLKEKVLTTTAKGKFTYTDRPHQPGSREYRVVVPAAKGVRSGVSKTVQITVYHWRELTSFSPRRMVGTATGSSVSVNGTSYGSSVTSLPGEASGSIDWNLDPSCRLLRARVGAGDNGDEGALATVALTADGAALYGPKVFGLRQSESQTFDIDGVLRLAFTWSSSLPGGTEPQPGAQAVLATPEVFCAV